MSFIYLVILSIIQGITEFLPISSSGHLVLLPTLMETEDQGLLLDIAVHFGTLLAVMLYFYKDLISLVKGGFDTITFKQTPDRGLFFNIIIATLPIIIAGFLVHHYIPQGFRDPALIGWTTLIFGILLGLADQSRQTTITPENSRLYKSFIIGLAQILALLPGTSRSGITMTACRFFGYDRVEASRFALLLGIPTIAGAAFLGFLDLIETNSLELQKEAMIAALLSCIFAYIAIAGLMRFVKDFNFMGFVIYRIILGSSILIWVYF